MGVVEEREEGAGLRREVMEGEREGEGSTAGC